MQMYGLTQLIIDFSNYLHQYVQWIGVRLKANSLINLILMLVHSTLTITVTNSSDSGKSHFNSKQLPTTIYRKQLKAVKRSVSPKHPSKKYYTDMFGLHMLIVVQMSSSKPGSAKSASDAKRFSTVLTFTKIVTVL